MNKKIVLLVLLAAAALVLYMSGDDSVAEPASQQSKTQENQFSPTNTATGTKAEMDNSSDELRAVLLELRTMKENYSSLTAKVENLASKEPTPDSVQVINKLQREFQEKNAEIDTLKNKVESLAESNRKFAQGVNPNENTPVTQSNVSSDLGVDGTLPKQISDSTIPILQRPGSKKPTQSSTTIVKNVDHTEGGIEADGTAEQGVIIWYEPDDAIIAKDKNGKGESTVTYPFSSKQISGITLNAQVQDKNSESAKAVGTTKSAQTGSTQQNGKEDSLKPIYTIPANSTLWDVTAMNTMIGRVPTSGSLNSPYRFKALVSSENMASNGIFIPNLKDMVVSGYLEGDMLLRCVRGNIDKATYTFKDGTIRTIDASQNNNSGSGKTVGIGWISDKWANPCIPGTYVSTIKEYLALIGGTNSIKAFGEALAGANTTTSTSGDVITTVTSGSTFETAVGAGLSGGAEAGGEFIEKRLEDAFDAVVIPAGRSIVLNIEQEMQIDYDTKGRKIVHQKNVEEYLN